MEAARPLKSEGGGKADSLADMYQLTKVFLGQGADGSVVRAIHRGTGTIARVHSRGGPFPSNPATRQPPPNAARPFPNCWEVASELLGGGFPTTGLRVAGKRPAAGVDASDRAGDNHALKYLSRSGYQGHHGLDRDREVTVLQLFQQHPHPNVLRLLWTFPPCPPGRPQWVHATLEAETNLRQIILRHDAALRQGEAAAARDFGRQILEGLSHMHRHRVIHRDLKPDNLLVSFDMVSSPAPSPENLVANRSIWKARLQIADFSRARVLPENTIAIKTRVQRKAPPRCSIAAMSVMICTRPYAAPELLSEDYDAKHAYGAGVDQWSFGCIFCELITGDVFSPGKNCLEVVAWWQVRLERPLPDHVCDELNIDLSRVEATARELRDKHPGAELGLAAVLAKEPWLSQTLIYEAGQRLTAKSLLSDNFDKGRPPINDTSQPLEPPASGPGPALPRCRKWKSLMSEAPASAEAASIADGGDAARGTESTPWSAAAVRTVNSDRRPQVATVSGICKCRGNCARRNEHRRDAGSTSGGAGCHSSMVHIGISLCDECKCKVPDCMRPGHRSVYCYQRLRVLEKLEWPLKAAIAMGSLAEFVLPADVTDLREHAAQPQTRADLASMIAIALIKEPSATGALVRSGCLAAMADPARRAADVAAMLTDLLTSEDVQKKSECEELGAQGVCRFTGFASTLRRFGVIATADSGPQLQSPSQPAKRTKTQGPSSSRGSKGQAAEETFPLGATRRQHKKTGDASMLEGFLNACRAEQAAWTLALTETSLVRAVEQIDGIMTRVATNSRVLQAEGGGYVRKFIARKLLLVCLWEGALDSTRAWSDVTVEMMERIMPDQTGYLEPIPRGWTCEELSNFVFGRGDMAMYASMYACLWKSVERLTKPKQRATIIETAMVGGRESEVGKQARALFEETGHQRTPKTIIARMIRNGKL